MRFLGDQKVTRYWSFEGIRDHYLQLIADQYRYESSEIIDSHGALGGPLFFATRVTMLKMHLRSCILMVERNAWYWRLRSDGLRKYIIRKIVIVGGFITG